MSGQTQQPAVQTSKAQAFWDNTAEKYASQPIEDMAAYEYTLERTRSYLSTGMQVAELGCGTGSTAMALAPNTGQYTGFDLAPAMLAIAEKKRQQVGLQNLQFRQGQGAADLASGSCDAILAFNLLHLLEDRPHSFQRIYQALKPGGLFISKTICLKQSGGGMKLALIKLVLPLMQAVGKAPYVAFFDINQLESEITAAGFTIIEAGNFPARPARRYLVARKP